MCFGVQTKPKHVPEPPARSQSGKGQQQQQQQQVLQSMRAERAHKKQQQKMNKKRATRCSDFVTAAKKEEAPGRGANIRLSVACVSVAVLSLTPQPEERFY